MVAEASAHETRSHLRVHMESMLPWEIFQDFKCLVNLVPPPIHFHENSKRKVGGPDVVLFHVLQDQINKIHPVVSSAAIHDCIVNDGVDSHSILLHASEYIKCFVKIAFDAVSFD